MPASISIAGRSIGSGNPCFIIAEAGVNHNGDTDLALKLVEAAKKTGADCVKFQTFSADRIVTDEAPKAQYQLKTTDPKESQKAMLKKLELSPDAYQDVVKACEKAGILFLSTPYSIEDIDFLDALGVPAFKFASMHIFEPSLLRYAASKGKPIIISTGMATLEEVRTGLEAMRSAGKADVVLLQCTTNYPSQIEDANLRAMQTMAEELNVLVGYSDHTQTNTACVASIALGACVIEKHFTLDTSMEGPDQSTSYDPEEFTQLVQVIRETEAALGSGKKMPSPAEVANATGMRRSIVAACDIPEGTVLEEQMLTLKRPATGVLPIHWDTVIGQKLKKALKENEMLTPAHVDL